MQNTKLRRYLEMNGISIRQAAKEIGVSRPLIHYALNGQPLGRKTALKIEAWSNGMLSAAELAGLEGQYRRDEL